MNTPPHGLNVWSRAPLFLVAQLTAAAILAAVPAAAAAATDIDCQTQSLQGAVDGANPGDVLHVFNGPCYGDVAVDKDLTIRGNRPNQLNTDVSGTITVAAGADVLLESLNLGGDYGHRAVVAAGSVTLRDSEIYGGGLEVDNGSATLIDTVVQESVYEFNKGGGIYSCGELHITGGWIGDNFAVEGAGIYVACGETAIVGTRLQGNGASRGGAVFVAAAADPTVTIANADLDYNQGYETGGAIHVAGGAVTVADSRITGNTAQDGGGIYNAGGNVAVTATLLQDNEAESRAYTPRSRTTTQKLSGPGPHLLEDVHVTTTTGPCVEISAGTHVTIRNVELGPCAAEGIVIEDSSGIGIYDSYIHPESQGGTGMAIRAVHSSVIKLSGNVITHGSTNLYAGAVSGLEVDGNLFVNPQGPFPNGKQIQVWGRELSGTTDLATSQYIDIEDNVLINSADPYWGASPDPGDAISLGYTLDAEVRDNHIIGGHGFQACGIITDDATVSGAQILNNVLVGTAQCGIGIAGGEDIEVRGNSILNGHVNKPALGGNVAMYAYNFYANETPVCDGITIEDNTATAIYRDGSLRDFDHPPAGSSAICTDAAGLPLTRGVVAARNDLGEAAIAALDPPHRTRPVPQLPAAKSRSSADSPYFAGPGRPNGNGGAVANLAGTIHIVGSTIADNTAGNSGGGIFNGWLGSADAEGSRISGNIAASGGGVANRGGDVSLRKSRSNTNPAVSLGITGNHATKSGGAVHNWYGLVVIRAVDLEDNTAPTGGAISNDVGGIFKVKRSTLVGNAASTTGGAIFTTGGRTIVRDTVLEANSAHRGGAVHALLGTLEVYDTTIAANSATDSGGGIALGSINQSDGDGNLEVGATAIIHDSDIEQNLRGGIHSSAGTWLELKRSRVRDNTGSGIIAEDPGALVPFVEVEIRKSTIKRNSQHGVEVDGTLLVKKSTIAKNWRSGISLRGPGAIRSTKIANNHAGAWVGCGRRATEVVIDETDFKGNAPNGGLYVACGDVSIADSSFVRNHDALEGGGALYAAESSVVEVSDTNFRRNRAKGPEGRVTGGAILNRGDMSLDGVTVNANTASGKGGGVHNTGALEIVNSTLSGNHSARRGGGLAASSASIRPQTTLWHVTVTENSATGTAGGFSATGGGMLDVFGSIVAGNSANGQTDVDISGSVSMISSYNVYGDCCDFTWSATDLTNVVDPKLGLLRDNGGPTRTHALLEGSPAIDLSPEGSCRVSLDQRNVTRPQGGGCDSGSFELE